MCVLCACVRVCGVVRVVCVYVCVSVCVCVDVGGEGTGGLGDSGTGFHK